MQLTHSNNYAVLALIVDTVATTNETDVDNALTAYDNLTPAAAKDLLITEKYY